MAHQPTRRGLWAIIAGAAAAAVVVRPSSAAAYGEAKAAQTAKVLSERWGWMITGYTPRGGKTIWGDAARVAMNPEVKGRALLRGISSKLALQFQGDPQGYLDAAQQFRNDLKSSGTWAALLNDKEMDSLFRARLFSQADDPSGCAFPAPRRTGCKPA